jgi:LysM repeat protein
MTAVAFAQQQFSFPPAPAPRLEPVVSLVRPLSTDLPTDSPTDSRPMLRLALPEPTPMVRPTRPLRPTGPLRSTSPLRPTGPLGLTGTVRAVPALAVRTRRPLSNAHLSTAHRSNAHLSNAHLSNAHLSNAPVWVMRAVLTAVLVAAAVTGLVVMSADNGLVSSPNAAVSVTPAAADAAALVHVVQPGDTLWSIAATVAPGSDPRPIVDELARRSGGTGLQPGQRIALEGLVR